MPSKSYWSYEKTTIKKTLEETFKAFNIQNLDYKVYNSMIIKINELLFIINVYRL